MIMKFDSSPPQTTGVFAHSGKKSKLDNRLLSGEESGEDLLWRLSRIKPIQDPDSVPGNIIPDGFDLCPLRNSCFSIPGETIPVLDGAFPHHPGISIHAGQNCLESFSIAPDWPVSFSRNRRMAKILSLLFVSNGLGVSL